VVSVPTAAPAVPVSSPVDVTVPPWIGPVAVTKFVAFTPVQLRVVMFPTGAETSMVAARWPPPTRGAFMSTVASI